jgi:hypothetical protein
MTSDQDILIIAALLDMAHCCTGIWSRRCTQVTNIVDRLTKIISLIFYVFFFASSWTRWRVDLPIKDENGAANICVKAVDEK